METVTVDDLPEEYHLWLGLQMVGLAAGDSAVLMERNPIKGNLFLCLFGSTGVGKSKAVRSQALLLREALPYDDDDINNTGVMLAATPGSAEALVDMFSKTERDPVQPSKIISYRGVRGLVRFDEFASLLAQCERRGSTLKPTLMQFYDSYEPIELRSRTAGYSKADRHFCSATTTTQPKVVRELFSKGDADSGFLNRWIFVAGELKPLDPWGGPEVDLSALVEPLRDLRAWASSGRSLQMDSSASSLWATFFRERLESHRVSDDNPLLTRLDFTLKKVMLLLAIDQKTPTIGADIVARALTLYPYLRQTYGLVDRRLNAGSQFDQCRARHS